MIFEVELEAEVAVTSPRQKSLHKSRLHKGHFRKNNFETSHPKRGTVILNAVKDLNQVSLDALAVQWFRSFSRIADSSIGKTLLQDDVLHF